ncbi:MAG: ABC transporter ATP-binding protein [Acidobacteria bacterium]|nr:MAG: ABC transporter ATP-binding protein [Acidobacteriota bacterium]
MLDADAFHEEESLGTIYDGRLMRRLLGYVAPYRSMAAAAVALILISSLLQLVGPLIVAATLDLFIRPPAEQQAFNRALADYLAQAGIALEPRAGVAAMALAYLGNLGLIFLVLYAQSYVMQMMGQRIMHDLRRDVFTALQELPIRYLDRNPTGRLVTRATTDVGALNELFTAGLVSIFGDVALLAGIIVVLFVINWQLALVSFSILPLLLALTLWFKSRARASYRRVRVRLARINAFLQEHVGGMSVVQLFGRQAAARDAFATINAAHRDANVQAIVYYAFYYPAIDLITALGLALIVWYGGGQVMAGLLTFGFLVAFLQYAQRFYQPLADLSEKVNILQAAMASAERIFALLDAERSIVSPPDAYRPEQVEGAIELDRVWFGYNPGEPVLRDVSFRIDPGETVAVVGHTGAGKSTLASLILRFYDVDRGRLLVDGVDVRRWDLERLRGAIALVLQDAFLFAGTLRQNLALGAPDADLERLRWAAREVQALDFIERLPAGFDTVVQERGAGLSVGQKQLIAFARALAVDPRILILDEATASIDTETEQRIQRALRHLLRGRTSLVIAHRLSTIKQADRILVLHKGRLREQGTHRQLLARKGIYYTLYQLQYREPARALTGG